MKKLILVLAIALIATPAFGEFKVTLSKRTGETIVDINYSGGDPYNLPRAFALDVNIGGAAMFTAINDYKVGESNAVVSGKPWSGPGYGIFPAQITFYDADDEIADPCHEEGDVNDWGSPLAAQSDIGAQDQILPSKHVILEFASLYKNPEGDSNAPLPAGRLCSLTYDCNGASGVDVCAIEEDIYRGGIVLEDGTAIELDINSLAVCGSSCTKPGKATNVSPTNGATGVSTAGTTLTWVAGTLATDHVVYFGTANPPPKVGIVAMPTVTYPTGALTINKKYYWHADANNGCGDPCVGTTWVFDTNCLYVGKTFAKTLCTPNLSADIVVTSTMVTQWNSSYINRANCWCCNPQKCGNGIYTPSTTLNKADGLDLAQVKKAYGKNYNVAGYVKCVDFNISGKVDGIDLGILKKHYGQTVGSTGCQ